MFIGIWEMNCIRMEAVDQNQKRKESMDLSLEVVISHIYKLLLLCDLRVLCSADLHRKTPIV